METILHGKNFVLCNELGDINSRTEGLYAHDTRVLSHLELRVDGGAPLSLGNSHGMHHHRRFVQRNVPGPTLQADAVLVTREYVIDRSLHVLIRIDNLHATAHDVPISLYVGADFDDVFVVKELEFGRLGIDTGAVGLDDERPHREQPIEGVESRDDLIAVIRSTDDRHVDVRSNRTPERIEAGRLEWRPLLEGRGTWQLELRFDWDRDPIQCELPEARSRLDQEHAAWITATPTLDGAPHDVARVWSTSIDDLAALRMEIDDADGSPCRIPAAGLPWFMTLFGRDTLLTSIQTMSLGVDLAQGVFRALAARQSAGDDAFSDAEPGKILHELREGGIADRGYDTYYGSVDSTPLFLVLLEEIHRWTGDDDFVREAWPHALRALEWIEVHADLLGDGYVRYLRRSDHGIENQSWRDSWDSQRFRDGSCATGAIAAAEVQGYAYDAYLRTARLAEHVIDDQPLASRLRDRAAVLQEQFLRDFWVLDDSLEADDPRAGGWFAMALDGEQRQVDALTSNIGHLLWSGIVTGPRAEATARQLMSPALNNGFGIRTMSLLDVGYSPLSYHCGTVWPHDTSICLAGLVRAGFTEEAGVLGRQLFDAAVRFEDGRLPELFAGLDRAQTDDQPVLYPTTCSPQAWAAAAPILVVAELLGVTPDSPAAAAPPAWLADARFATRD